MKIIYRFSLIVLCCFILVGCNDPVVEKQVKEKIEVIDKIKNDFVTIGIYGFVQQEGNAEKIFDYEKQLEKKLKVEIVVANKKEIKLRITKIKLLNILKKIEEIFKDHHKSFDLQYQKFISILDSEYNQRKEIKELIFNNAAEINPELIYLELYGVDDLKTLEKFKNLIDLYAPETVE